MSLRAPVRRFVLRTAAVIALFLCLALIAAYVWLGSPQALQWAAHQATLASGGNLVIDGTSGALAGDIEVEKITYTGDGFRLEAQKIRLRWQPLALLQGNLRINRMTAASVRYTTIAAAYKPSVMPENLALPLPVTISTVEVGRLEVDTLPVAADVRLRYDGGRKAHELQLAGMRIAEWNFLGTLRTGTAPPFATGGTLKVQGKTRSQAAEISAMITGNLDRLNIETTAHGNGSSAQAAAILRPYAPAPIEKLDVRAKNVDLSRWHESLPRSNIALAASAQSVADGHLQGRLQADNAIAGHLDQGLLPLTAAGFIFSGRDADWAFTEIELRPGGSGRLRGNGTLRGDTARFNLRLQDIDPSRLHGRLRPVVISGNALLSGDAARQKLEATLSGAGIRSRIIARHDGRALIIDSARLQAGSGRLDVDGQLALDATQEFSLNGRFSQFDPSRFLQAPAGLLNGTAMANGQLQPAWQARLDLTVARSTLRGIPFNARAQFTSSADTLFAGTASAAVGTNKFNASGTYGRAQDRLLWNIDAPDLRAIDPALAGTIKGQGTFAGTAERPTLEFSLAARRLILRDYRISSLDAQGAISGDALAALRLEGRATGVQSPQVKIDSLELRSSGTRARHVLTAALNGQGADATLRASGSLDAQWQWTGTLEQLEARGPWPLRLTAPASLAFGPGLIAIEHLRVTALDGDFGPAGFRSVQGQITTNGTFRNIAAARLLSHNSAIEVRNLRLGGGWNLTLGDNVSGNAELHREQGDIALTGNGAVVMDLRRMSLALTAAVNAIDIAADIDSDAMGSATANIKTSVARRDGTWLLPRDAALSGTATADVRSLAWVRALLPEIDRVAGRLAGQATLSGTIADPRYSGTLTGDGIALRVLEPGIDLREGRLRATLDGNRLKLEEFRLNAGQGRITASGSADLTAGLRELDIIARAERAQIITSPQLSVTISGEGRAGLRDRRLALEGNFSVDNGRYDLGSERKPALGSDVMVKTAGSRDRPKPAPSRVDLAVSINLNDRFTVRGYGLDALLGGTVRIASRGEGLSAVGTVRTVRGEYSAFGQDLDIERGALLFSGPLSNPGIDLRAVRKFASVEVGVEVAGSLQRPSVKLVSTPDMPDSDRMGWLVLGRDPQGASRAELALLQAAALSLASSGGPPIQRQFADRLGLDEVGFGQGGDGGLGVLALGKRITSQITVRLEQTLGGTAGSLLRVEYMLSERWRLRGTTGAENAGDILFTLRFD